jgi:hypothetical protein
MADIGAGVGGVAQAAGSIAAASIAADASKHAADQIQKRYETTRGDLLPYNQAGQNALGNLSSLATSGPTGGGPDYINWAGSIGVGPLGQANLERTPGYQFQLAQGLKSTQASAAARGLGVSGAALKGAATFATGLASSNYQQQFQNALALNTAQQGNLLNQYNRLSGVASLGENAAAQTGTTGASLANSAAAATQNAGTASAAGVTGVGNAISGSINNYLSNKALQDYTGQTAGYNKVNYNDSGYSDTPTGGF